MNAGDPVDAATTGASRTTTDLDLHLRVVGGLLEEHRLYRGPRLEAVKDIVLQIFRELAPDPLSLRRIQEVLCYNDVPLVSEEVLRQALNSLVRTDAKIKTVAKTPKQYVLTVDVPPSSDSLRLLIENCWERHFHTCGAATFEHFQRCVALLFARYGCAAYDTLTSSAAASVRLEKVFDDISLPPSDRDEFADCFSEFILSPDPADATVKVKLASAYALLRMNGAGNWGHDDLRTFFSGRTFLLDTNILFELMSRNVGQVTKMFRYLQEFGARFVVGSETRKEFETALRAGADQVSDLTARAVDLVSLVDAHLVKSDWIKALFTDFRSPSRQQIHERVELLLKQVDAMLEEANVIYVHLERSADTKDRETRIERVQQFAKEVRHLEKHAEVARHDALLWEAVDDEPRLADMVLTLDRSLGRIKCGTRRVAIMLDEVVAYAMMGGAGEAEIVDLFGHALSQDLYPNSPFLQMQDIKAIANMEATLLTGPTRALRHAAAQLSEVRAKRAASGEPVSDDEIGRILVSSISSYRDDRAVAQREREAAAAERARAAHEAERRALAEREADSAKQRAERVERELEDEKRSTTQRLNSLEASIEQLRGERANLQAELEEKKRRRESEASEEELRKDANRKRRDWMLFVAAFGVLAGGLVFLGIYWAAALAAVVAIGAATWTALAQETPSVSLPLVAFIVSVVVAGTGIAEKWPQARALLRLQSPTALTNESSQPAAPTMAPPEQSGAKQSMGSGTAQMVTNQQPQTQHRPAVSAPAATPAAAPAAPPADERSPAQRLKELKELFDAGVLSDKEYNAKRAELMKLL